MQANKNGSLSNHLIFLFVFFRGGGVRLMCTHTAYSALVGTAFTNGRRSFGTTKAKYHISID